MDISKTVYSLYWPETRQIVDDLWKAGHHSWYEDNYTKKQNDMHGPYLSGWREWAAKANVDIGKQFKHEYPTNGASEAIQHLISHYATRKIYRDEPVIHVFEGEYEGYRKIAEALNLKVYTHPRSNIDAEAMNNIKNSSSPGDIFFLSQPSAIDGNVWENFDGWLHWMNTQLPDVDVVIDLTYVGAVAKNYNIYLHSQNVKAVLWSLSKPFGVYYHRIGGILSAFELPTLYGNYWFKNLFSLHLGIELMKTYGPHDLPRKYHFIKEDIIKSLPIELYYPPYESSDVILLAHRKIKDIHPGQETSEYIRTVNKNETIFRYCLTPALDRIINNK